MTRLIQEYCTRSSQRQPNATAVSLSDWKCTFGELEATSNRIAHVLRETGCKRGDRIGLLIRKSPMAVAAIHGILKADGIYMPLDPDSPAKRASDIIQSGEPRVILADSSSLPLLEAIIKDRPALHFHIGWLGEERPGSATVRPVFNIEDVRSAQDAPLNSMNSGSDPAYVIYTSGSTGAPKGVVINHSNVAHFIEWATAQFQIGPDDRMSGHAPLHFDLSVFDIFGSLCAGAELHLVPNELNLRPAGMAEFIRENQLTQWFSVPAVLNYMAKFNAVEKHDFPALRRVMWCGEVFPASGLQYWMTRLPHVSFTNLYGPTETTVASSYHTLRSLPQGDGHASIGQACRGEQLFVLNEEMKPVEPGETGEIYIGGVGISPGYWKDPAKTAAVFVRNPFSNDTDVLLYRTGDLAKIADDGQVYFLGRRDSQIKTRGYRIELGEIEAALNEVHILKESAVIAATTDGFERHVICCAYSPAPGAAVTPVQLRNFLRTRIPAYMMPSRWMEMDRLPRNANGKTDKSALKELFSTE
jgi:amino acid adenylation domain-containing protein